jgi:hypothetical protein
MYIWEEFYIALNTGNDLVSWWVLSLDLRVNNCGIGSGSGEQCLLK